MSDKTLLEEIGKVIDQRFKAEREHTQKIVQDAIQAERVNTRELVREEIIAERVNTRELVREEIIAERVNTRELIHEEFEAFEKKMSKKISASADDVIDSLKMYIEEGYDQHEVRIVRIEDHLDLPPLKH